MSEYQHLRLERDSRDVGSAKAPRENARDHGCHRGSRAPENERPAPFRARPRDRRNGSDDPVAALRNGLDEAWMFCVITEREADLLDAVIEPLLEVDERSGPPGPLEQLLPGDQVAGVCRQPGEDLERLRRQLDQ